MSNNNEIPTILYTSGSVCTRPHDDELATKDPAPNVAKAAITGHVLLNDVVPAMLSPGVSWVSRQTMDNFGIDLLKKMNASHPSGEAPEQESLIIQIPTNHPCSD